MKYLVVLLVWLAFCGVIWFNNAAKEELKQFEGQISLQYIHANFLLRDNVDEFLQWDFNQTLNEEDKEYIRKLSYEFLYINGILFSGKVVHKEWGERISDIHGYLNKYVYGPPLSEQDANDLEQALQATYFISMDFTDFTENTQDFYDAMHDKNHEMVERVKSRLAMNY